MGITGVPGVGKSSFIEVLGKLLTNKGHKVAVLILIQHLKKHKAVYWEIKSRMHQLSVDENALFDPHLHQVI